MKISKLQIFLPPGARQRLINTELNICLFLLFILGQPLIAQTSPDTPKPTLNLRSSFPGLSRSWDYSTEPPDRAIRGNNPESRGHRGLGLKRLSQRSKFFHLPVLFSDRKGREDAPLSPKASCLRGGPGDGGTPDALPRERESRTRTAGYLGSTDFPGAPAPTAAPGPRQPTDAPLRSASQREKTPQAQGQGHD